MFRFFTRSAALIALAVCLFSTPTQASTSFLISHADGGTEGRYHRRVAAETRLAQAQAKLQAHRILAEKIPSQLQKEVEDAQLYLTAVRENVFAPTMQQQQNNGFTAQDSTSSLANGCANGAGFLTVPVGASGGQAFQAIVHTAIGTTGFVYNVAPYGPSYNPALGGIDQNTTATGSFTYGPYGSQSLSGEVYSDSITLGTGSQASKPTSMRFLAASNVNLFNNMTQCFYQAASADPTQLNWFQGVLGLGPQPNDASKTDSFLSLFAQQNTNYKNLFGLMVCPTGGQLWLGDVDGWATSGGWTDIKSIGTTGTAPPQPAYSFNTVDIEIGGQSVGAIAADWPNAGFINSASNFWDLPNAVFNKVVTALRSDPNVQTLILKNNPNFFSSAAGSCYPLPNSPSADTLNSQLPRIKLVIDKDAGISVEMPAAYGYLRPMDRTNQLWCPSIRAGSSVHSMGLPFLNNFVVKVDRSVTPNIISFATSAGCFNVPGNGVDNGKKTDSFFVLQIVLLCLVIGGTLFFAIFLFVQHRRRYADYYAQKNGAERSKKPRASSSAESGYNPPKAAESNPWG